MTRIKAAMTRISTSLRKQKLISDLNPEILDNMAKQKALREEHDVKLAEKIVDAMKEYDAADATRKEKVTRC